MEMNNKEDIIKTLEKVPSRLENDSFLSNKGLSNEVGIHILCYNPQDEMTVRAYFDDLIKNQDDKKYNLIKCDLYEIFLSLCEEKRILEKIPALEQRRGKDTLLKQLQRGITPEQFVKKMDYENHKFGDVLLITGVGKVFPFMRSHNILENIQPVINDIPILILYPGKYNGQSLDLFGTFTDGNYYRAFNLI